MAYTFEQLKAKTLVELRDIARSMTDESVKGWSQMNKDHLLPAICKAFGIDTHVHHHVVGLDKSQMKARLKALKKKRDEAIEAGDHDAVKAIRRERHGLSHRIRRATV